MNASNGLINDLVEGIAQGTELHWFLMNSIVHIKEIVTSVTV